MKVTVEDKSVFKRMKIIIEAEDIDEIYGLLATFNVSAADRIAASPIILEKLGKDILLNAIHKIEMPLWEAIHPIYKKVAANIYKN